MRVVYWTVSVVSALVKVGSGVPPGTDLGALIFLTMCSLRSDSPLTIVCCTKLWIVRKLQGDLRELDLWVGSIFVVFLSIYSFIYLLILLLSARWATLAMHNRRFRCCCYIRRRIYFVLLSILAPALNPSWLTKRVMCPESRCWSQGLYVLKSVISLRSTSLTPGRKQ